MRSIFIHVVVLIGYGTGMKHLLASIPRASGSFLLVVPCCRRKWYTIEQSNESTIFVQRPFVCAVTIIWMMMNSQDDG